MTIPTHQVYLRQSAGKLTPHVTRDTYTKASEPEQWGETVLLVIKDTFWYTACFQSSWLVNVVQKPSVWPVIYLASIHNNLQLSNFKEKWMGRRRIKDSSIQVIQVYLRNLRRMSDSGSGRAHPEGFWYRVCLKATDEQLTKNAETCWAGLLTVLFEYYRHVHSRTKNV